MIDVRIEVNGRRGRPLKHRPPTFEEVLTFTVLYEEPYPARFSRHANVGRRHFRANRRTRDGRRTTSANPLSVQVARREPIYVARAKLRRYEAIMERIAARERRRKTYRLRFDPLLDEHALARYHLHVRRSTEASVREFAATGQRPRGLERGTWRKVEGVYVPQKVSRAQELREAIYRQVQPAPYGITAKETAMRVGAKYDIVLTRLHEMQSLGSVRAVKVKQGRGPGVLKWYRV